ncbi:ABC-type transport system protein [alpha proteobacterium U9-1i]|nr:ABC-type transport system protein [alpha proteobacterium U9-1i]
METKAKYVLLGTATLIGAVFIMLFAMWMANSDFRRGYNEFDIVFDDPVRGLAEGGEVRFNGIKVGEVQTLRIDPRDTRRVIARVRVSADVPVKTDSLAQLEPIGLTGVTLIQLSAGSDGAPEVRQAFGGPVPSIEGEGSQIDALVARSEDIALRASEAMAAVRDLLTDENIARVTRIVENLETVSAQLAGQRSVITQSGDAAREITALARQLRQDTAQLDQVMQQVNTAAGVASGQTLPELALAAEEIRRAAGNISRVAQNIEENPSVLTPQAPRPTVELRP